MKNWFYNKQTSTLTKECPFLQEEPKEIYILHYVDNGGGNLDEELDGEEVLIFNNVADLTRHIKHSPFHQGTSMVIRKENVVVCEVVGNV